MKSWLAFPSSDSVVIVTHNRMAGRTDAYNVARIYYDGRDTHTIGRELPLELARKVARRSSAEDGNPLTH